MKVTEIVVNAGRTFNHPHESYSNLRPSVTLKATIEDGEDFEQAAKELQAKAESLVEDHKQNMLRSLEELFELETRQREVKGLYQEIKRAQERLNLIREETPQLELPMEDSEEKRNDPDIDPQQ